MAIAAVGLQTHIWNNQIKSVLLLLGFPLLLLVLLGVLCALVGTPSGVARAAYDPTQAAIDGVARYGHWVILAAAVWFAIAWVMHTSIINAVTGAKPVTRQQAPEIYNMLENLCISKGMRMPRLQVIDSPALNAFASGINDNTYTITLTRGIVQALDKQALEAVIAHELAHIRHRDVRLLIIAVIFAGIISFVCEIIYRMIIYGGTGRQRDGRVILLGFAVMAIGYVLALSLRFALSRRREYLADAGAVELTRNPDAMIRALRRISGRSEMPDVPVDVRQMMIENKAELFGMFATHPPIEARVQALVMLGGRDTGELPAPPSAVAAQQETGEARPWRRRHGPWG